MLTNEDKKLIAKHTQIEIDDILVIFRLDFECDMGQKYTLIMFNNCQYEKDGRRVRHGYILKHKGKAVFSGYDLFTFGDMSQYVYDRLNGMELILAFLSLQKYDTDSEHFEKYSKFQLAWRDNYAENVANVNSHLQGLLNEPEDYEDHDWPISYYGFMSYGEIEQEAINTNVIDLLALDQE